MGRRECAANAPTQNAELSIEACATAKTAPRVPIAPAGRGIGHTFWLRWSSVETVLGPGVLLKLSKLLMGEEAGQRISTERRDRGERGGLDGRARQGIKDEEPQEMEAAIRF